MERTSKRRTKTEEIKKTRQGEALQLLLERDNAPRKTHQLSNRQLQEEGLDN